LWSREKNNNSSSTSINASSDEYLEFSGGI
jgi:hypothetical protein